MIEPKAITKVMAHIDDALSKGAKLITGGKELGGLFFEPGVLTGVTTDMIVAREETFGPLAPLFAFDTEEEVIDMANDSIYGLGGAVWTRDINRALRVAKGVQTGRMWVNTYNALPAGAPFGGYKLSGIGRETDRSTMYHYMQTKNILINFSEKPNGYYE